MFRGVGIHIPVPKADDVENREEESDVKHSTAGGSPSDQVSNTTSKSEGDSPINISDVSVVNVEASPTSSPSNPRKRPRKYLDQDPGKENTQRDDGVKQIKKPSQEDPSDVELISSSSVPVSQCIEDLYELLEDHKAEIIMDAEFFLVDYFRCATSSKRRSKEEPFPLYIIHDPTIHKSAADFLKQKQHLLQVYRDQMESYKERTESSDSLRPIAFHFVKRFWIEESLRFGEMIQLDASNTSVYCWNDPKRNQHSRTRTKRRVPFNFISEESHIDDDAGEDEDPTFADFVVASREPLTQESIQKLKDEGYTDEEIAKLDKQTHADVDNMTPMCHWKSIDLTIGDYNRLEAFEYLNDNILDMALGRLNVPDNCFIFNTFFYKFLERNPERSAKKIPAPTVKLFDKDYLFIPINRKLHWSLVIVCLKGVKHCQRITPSRKRKRKHSEEEHVKVVKTRIVKRKRRSKTTDTADAASDELPVSSTMVKDDSISQAANPPVKEACENSESHRDTPLKKATGTLIPSSPDEMVSNSEENGQDSKDQSSMEKDSDSSQLYHVLNESQRAIIGCDSLRQTNFLHGAMTKVRNYLSLRWDIEHPKMEKEANPTQFSSTEFKGSYASLPMQNNDCDCGVFVIRYVEELLKSPPTQIPMVQEDLFSLDSIIAKRRELKGYIDSIAQEQGFVPPSPKDEKHGHSEDANPTSMVDSDSDSDLEIISAPKSSAPSTRVTSDAEISLCSDDDEAETEEAKAQPTRRISRRKKAEDSKQDDDKAAEMDADPEE